MTDLRGNCTECKRPMRNHRCRIAEYPGTVPFHAQGMCSGCYRRYKQDGANLPKKPKTAVDVTATRQSLTAYLEWRKPFRAKAGQS